MEYISVAIDGPSGAGKSTLAKEIAAQWNYLYVDTGAIYRTIAYYVLCNQIEPACESAVTDALPGVEIRMSYETDGLQHMYLTGQDVTKEIRLPEVSRYASLVSAHPPVRAFLLEMQRQLARNNHVIMDGRDIGTVVLPDAQVKIFLTATPEARAYRRWRELEQRGTPQPYETVLSDIQTRDYNDTNRDVAPLKQAPGAVLLDTTEMNFQQSKEALLRIIQEKVSA